MELAPVPRVMESGVPMNFSVGDVRPLRALAVSPFRLIVAATFVPVRLIVSADVVPLTVSAVNLLSAFNEDSAAVTWAAVSDTEKAITRGLLCSAVAVDAAAPVTVSPYALMILARTALSAVYCVAVSVN